MTIVASRPANRPPSGRADRGQPRPARSRAIGGSQKPGRSPGGPSLARRLLLSEYFILYLTAAYFVCMAIVFPDLASPRNLSNQLSNVWPLLAVAIGQTFVVIIGGIDLSQGAVMGFVSVARRCRHDDSGRPRFARRQPAVGLHDRRERRLARRQQLGSPRRDCRDARRRPADRLRQRRADLAGFACRPSW